MFKAKRYLALCMAFMLAMPMFARAEESSVEELYGEELVCEYQEYDLGQTGFVLDGDFVPEIPGTEEETQPSDEPAQPEPEAAFDEAGALNGLTLSLHAEAGVYPAGSMLSVLTAEDGDFARLARALVDSEAEVSHVVFDLAVMDAAGNASVPDIDRGIPVAKIAGLPLVEIAEANPGSDIAVKAVLLDAVSGNAYAVNTWIEGEDVVCFEMPDCARVDVMTVVARPEVSAEEDAPAVEEEASVVEEEAVPVVEEEAPVDEEEAPCRRRGSFRRRGRGPCHRRGSPRRRGRGSCR